MANAAEPNRQSAALVVDLAVDRAVPVDRDVQEGLLQR